MIISLSVLNVVHSTGSETKQDIRRFADAGSDFTYTAEQ